MYIYRAIANLQMQADQPLISNGKSGNRKNSHQHQQWFSKSADVGPFIDKYWDELCNDRTRSTTWLATIGSCIYTTKDVFKCQDEKLRNTGPGFRLVDECLYNVRPGGIQRPFSFKSSGAQSESYFVLLPQMLTYPGGTSSHSRQSSSRHAAQKNNDEPLIEANLSAVPVKNQNSASLLCTFVFDNEQ